MITDNIKQSDKAKVFDWLVEKLEDGTLEILFKADSTGENDLVSVSDFNGLVGELEVCSQSLSRKKSANYVLLTMNQFNYIREEVYSGYSQAGAMDDEAGNVAIKAYCACSAAERANLVPPLSYDAP
ncbi:hypothetical protein [Vibrio alginolyticus]|uniref:hypothetical protein n=1 Tax=Vibrio alginolyticus TaxID=663 RepID=UPI0015F643A2|nr:hypothetical protein [Vibrio alginolyticus]